MERFLKTKLPFFSCCVFCLVFVLTQPSLSEAGGCSCPPLWTGYQKFCYRYFTSGNVSWSDAEMNCRSFTVPCTEGALETAIGHLVSVHSQAEMDFLSVMYETLRTKRGNSRVWIGLHDRIEESSQEWTDGSILDYVSWASGQPNDFNGAQDCVFFQKGQNPRQNPIFQWFDFPCGTSAGVESYICKLPKW